MLRDLESGKEIRRQVDRLLLTADAYGRFPTPVEDIVAAAKLTVSRENPLDQSALKLMPAYLRAKMRSVLQKVQGALDRRERLVHVNPQVDRESRRRFVLLHETTHAVLPHQQDLVFADDMETLAPSVKQLFEQEANQGAAELLFQLDRFGTEVNDHLTSLATVQLLSERYGASFHATARRFAEVNKNAVALVVFDPKPADGQQRLWRRREVVYSKQWETSFGRPRWPVIMSPIRHSFVSSLDVPDYRATTMNGLAFEGHTVQLDVVKTPYNAFVLLWFAPKRRLIQPRKVSVVTAA